MGILTAATRGLATILGCSSLASSVTSMTMLSVASSCGASDQRCKVTTDKRSASDEKLGSPIGAMVSAYSRITATFDCVKSSFSSAGNTFSGERERSASSNPSADTRPAFLTKRTPVERL